MHSSYGLVHHISSRSSHRLHDHWMSGLVLASLKQISDAMPAASETRIDVREMTISKSSIVMKAETDVSTLAASS